MPMEERELLGSIHQLQEVKKRACRKRSFGMVALFNCGTLPTGSEQPQVVLERAAFADSRVRRVLVQPSREGVCPLRAHGVVRAVS
jgi:hypothetical protein